MDAFLIVVDLVQTVSRAIQVIQSKELNPVRFHDEVKEMYSWMNVAERTEKVRTLTCHNGSLSK